QRFHVRRLIAPQIREEIVAREQEAEERQPDDVPDSAAFDHERPFRELTVPEIRSQYVEKRAVRIRLEHGRLQNRVERSIVARAADRVRVAEQEQRGALENEEQGQHEHGRIAAAIKRYEDQSRNSEDLQDVSAIDE